MDIGDSYDPHQQQQQQQPQPQPLTQEQQQQQQNAMQCEAMDAVMEGPPHQLNNSTAIPLPAPPNMLMAQPAQQQRQPEMDIDAVLLQQFSCMGTTDHEDLITQFLSLINNQMNRDSARFFLEMSNWNLQTAVGCYLDFYSTQTVPSMKIVQSYRPTEFQQAWRLQNDGTEDWPRGSYLMSPSQTRRLEIQQAIKPGETCDILAEVPSSQPAIMWRLCTPNGWYFGETIWMIPPGTCNTQTDLADRMSQLRTSPNAESFPQVNIVISVNGME